MDLSQLSKETLISIINDLQDQIKQLKQETTQTTIYDVDSQAESIPNEKPIPDFGNGPIRYKKDGKYYHGIDPTFYASWDKSGKWTKEHIGCMFHYTNKEVKLPHEEWDTHEIKDFCHNWNFLTDKNKRKKTRFIYRCNGHSI